MKWKVLNSVLPVVIIVLFGAVQFCQETKIFTPMRSRKIILVVFVFLALSAVYILLTDPWSTTGDALSRLMPGDVPGKMCKLFR